MTSSTLLNWQRGVHAGLALLFCTPGFAEESLHDDIRDEYKHQSYLLIEHSDGATIYLFDESATDGQALVVHEDDAITAALARTRDTDPRVRARALAELAGVDGYEVLSVGLELLNDPDPAVRDEAKYLILDHPLGEDIAKALELVDEELEE